MNILVLNGNPDAGNRLFDEYINRYQIKLHIMGHYVKHYQLRDMRFSGGEDDRCDLPQEGPIIAQDDTRYILNSLQGSDLLIIASPLIPGKIASLSGLIQARIVSHFRQIVNTQNRSWDDRSLPCNIPLMGVVLQTDFLKESRELLLNKIKQERLALSFNSILCFQITMESSPNEAVCETLKSANYQLSVENTCNSLLTSTAGQA